MSPVVVCETAAGLFLQIGIVVLVTVLIERWLGSAKSICRLWTTCFIAILALTSAAIMLPHFRSANLWSESSSQTVMTVVAWQTAIGKAFVTVWLSAPRFWHQRPRLRAVR